MDKAFIECLDILKVSRDNYLKFLEPYDLAALNTIPPNFNNNIAWNFGHVIVTQQLLCYKLANLPMYIDDTLVNKYRKGTKPEEKINEEELEMLKSLATSLVDKFQQDLEKEIFSNYISYRTSFNVELTNILQATIFNNVHEGMHLGTCLALKKFL